MKREDDYLKRREHLKNLSNEELKERFWKLTEEVVKPLVDLAYDNTSASIERSVLLRMGISSLDAGEIVKQGAAWDLLGKGMGNVVLTYAKMKNIDYRDAGKELAAGTGWNEISKEMRGDK